MFPSGPRTAFQSASAGLLSGEQFRPTTRQTASRPAPYAGPPQFAPQQSFPGLTHVLLGMYSLMLTVPIAEILIVYLHAHISVVVIVEAFLTILLIMSGKLGRFFETPMAKPWMALLVIYAISAVLGIYKGESVPFVFQYGIRFHVLPLYYCALALTTDQVRKSLRWIAWGQLLLIFLCFKFGGSEDGRFMLPDTSLSNPNDLAFAFLFGMGCLSLNRSKITRLLAVATGGVMIYFILKTASRASLITLVVMIVALFIFSSRGVKIGMIVAVPALAALLMSLTPSFALKRLSLISPSAGQVGNDMELKAAMDSEDARSQLQKRAIELAMHYPLLGVGPLEFINGVEQMVQSNTGHKSGWQGAHNSYLQIAAEDGIPAMILYLLTLFYCIKVNIQSYRICRRTPALKHASTQCLALILMTIAFLVCVAFSNNGYDPRVGLLIALSAANFLAVRDELKMHNAAIPAVNARQMAAVEADPRRNLRMPRPVIARW